MTLSFSVSTTSLAIENLLTKTSSELRKSMERLASGYRVNSAADGAADLAISNTMEAQLHSYTAASGNVQQGLSILGIADGALQNIMSHLQNIREIAVGASNTSNSSADFTNYQTQLQAEIASITNIATSTKFGSNVLLNGTLSGAAFNIQVGPNSGDTLDIKAAFGDNQANSGLSLTQNTIASVANAGTVLTQADAAIATLNANLATVGGLENRLTDQLSYLSTASTNVSAAQASIRNTDVAQETANLARLQILQQAGAYALAQANLSSQTALSLLPR